MKCQIRFSNENEIQRLVELSEAFEQEECCNGIVSDDYNHFANKKVAVCLVKGEIVGYCYGTIEKEDMMRSYSNVGDLIYYLDEMYLLPEYRNCGIGKRLFEYVEKYAKQNSCKTIRLNAVSKDYKRLLSFYIEELGMNFWSAFLVKNI